jgi:hypothetical protein
MELERCSIPFDLAEDKRPKMEEPPPVRLVAVDDCVLLAPAGLERDLDGFYVGLLKFERLEEEGIVYRAENFSLRFSVIERFPEREDLRPLGIAVPSLVELRRQLEELEIEFMRQRGITPGLESILLRDPAGNSLEITEFHIAI